MKRFYLILRSTMRDIRAYFAEAPLRLLPIVDDWRQYDLDKFKKDLKAGFNTALLGFPQGIAYAVIAGVNIVYGIACEMIAGLTGSLFKSSRATITGPTNATAFMIFSFFATYPLLGGRINELLPLLALLVSLLMLAGAFFRVADILQYVSRSVVVGFITGAALLIMVNQLNEVFGLAHAMQASDSPRSFYSIVVRLIEVLPAMEWAPMTIAAITLGFYYAGRRWLGGWPVFALALVVGSLVTWLLGLVVPEFANVRFFDSFQWSALVPALPSFDTMFWDDMATLFSLALAVAFLASLENSIMAKTLAGRTGVQADLNQDMFALGIGNFACSLFNAMPASGSLTRSKLNHQSGAATRMSAVFASMSVGLIALLCGGLVTYIPRACLAALVIAIAIGLIQPRNLRICLRATRSDATTLLVTLGSTLVAPLHVAIFVGVATSVILYLRKAARPELVEYGFTDEGELAEAPKRNIPAISIVHVEGDLFFGASELFRSQIQRACLDENLKVIILRLRNARNLDATSVLALEELIEFVNEKGRYLLISGITKNVYRVLKNAGMINLIGRENFFVHSPGNPNISTRNALIRAQKLLGTQEADIQIFVKPKPPEDAKELQR